MRTPKTKSDAPDVDALDPSTPPAMEFVSTSIGVARLERQGETLYSLSGLSESQSELLRAIPGLRVKPNGVSGRVDAIAAALLQVGASAIPINTVEVESIEGLRPYQAQGVATLMATIKNYGGALLADDVGLGKTRQALEVAYKLGGRLFVVCPAYCRGMWLDEVHAVGMSPATVVLGPSITKADEAAWKGAHGMDIVITSYELANKAYTIAFQHEGPQLLIMDEAHYLGGRSTKRSKALETIARLTPCKLALTGTPVYSRPRDLYMLMRILGARMGTGWEFDFRYCAGFLNKWGGLDNRGSSHEAELKQRLTYYMVRREKREVLSELPPLTRQIVWVDGTEKARTAFLKACHEERHEKATIAALIATLDEKIDTAVELATNARRFVLFTYLKRHAAEIHRRLVANDTMCVLITGDVPHEQRESLAKQATANGWGVVATIDSAGVGINSLRDVASYGIMHTIPWLPMQALQAEGRLHRMGQLGNVHWVYVAMRDSMDELVVNACVNKLDAVRSLLPSMEEGRSMRDALDDSGVNAKGLLTAMYEAMDAMTESDHE